MRHRTSESETVCVCVRERERQLKQMKIANFDVWRLFHARLHSGVSVDVDVSTDNGTHMCVKGVREGEGAAKGHKAHSLSCRCRRRRCC